MALAGLIGRTDPARAQGAAARRRDMDDGAVRRAVDIGVFGLAFELSAKSLWGQFAALLFSISTANYRRSGSSGSALYSAGIARADLIARGAPAFAFLRSDEKALSSVPGFRLV